MGKPIPWKVALGLTPSLLTWGCSCDTLWGWDAPRPELAREDIFSVSPSGCVDVPADARSIADEPRLVVMKGTRRSSGLGAEAVPVEVYVGPCRSGGNADAGAPDSGSTSWTAPEVWSADGGLTTSCNNFTLSTQPDAVLLRGNPERGCTELSSRHLSCTLDASGVASFSVVAGNANAWQSGYTPICIQPKSEGDRFTALNAVLAGVSGVFRLSPAIGAAMPPPPGNVCSALVACDSPRAQPFVLGLVGADVPRGGTTPRDFVPVKVNLDVEVSVQTLEGVSPSGPLHWLTAADTCDLSKVATELSTQIPAGASNSPSLLLCSQGYAGSYRLALNTRQNVNVEPGYLDTDLPALIQGIVALPIEGSMTRSLSPLTCGGAQNYATQWEPANATLSYPAECTTPTPTSNDQPDAAPAVNDASSDASLDASSDASFPADTSQPDAAGGQSEAGSVVSSADSGEQPAAPTQATGSAQSAPTTPTALGAQCRDATLQLRNGHVCQLQGVWP